MKTHLKKLAALLITLALVLVGCIACGQQPAVTSPGTDAPAPAAPEAPIADAPANPADVKIGILIPGSPTDGGFSQAAAEAGKKMQEAYGYTVSVVQAADGETIKSEGETMAAEGYKIVFGHGGQCSSPFAEISPDYPDTWFFTFGGTEIRDNQAPVSMNAEEGFYVLGILAAKMTQTNKIAWSVGGDYPAYTKTVNAWELGARSVNPDIEIMGAVLSATNATEGYETTLNQIANGADFIVSNSNEAQAGAIKAVAESAGVYAIGAIGDFTAMAPDSVYANVLGDYTAGYMKATEAVMNGTAKAEILFLTMADDCVSVVWNDALKATLPQDVVAACDEAIAAIIAGTIKVPNEFEQN
ncbi:MAG: BMP family protein [Christensenellaceae bacterium]|jgi:basic membrane lipoprotein Med (substrate-binding protein (PBP1-ABC) superfamily)|nr:BMP family protein [Christensenellaceae bacterium]